MKLNLAVIWRCEEKHSSTMSTRAQLTDLLCSGILRHIILLVLLSVMDNYLPVLQSVAHPGIFYGGGSINSVEDRGQ